jgi:hypothetical protein
MSAVGVFLGGEGRNELGGRADHPKLQTAESHDLSDTRLLRRHRSTAGAMLFCASAGSTM